MILCAILRIQCILRYIKSILTIVRLVIIYRQIHWGANYVYMGDIVLGEHTHLTQIMTKELLSVHMFVILVISCLQMQTNVNHAQVVLIVPAEHFNLIQTCFKVYILQKILQQQQ